MIRGVDVAGERADLGRELVDGLHGHILVRCCLCVQCTPGVVGVHACFSVVSLKYQAQTAEPLRQTCQRIRPNTISFAYCAIHQKPRCYVPQSLARRSEVDVTTPNTIAQTLERARGLLAQLVDQNQVDRYKARGPAVLGGTQLKNMLIHVSNMEARVAATAEDPANAVKRLRDFSRIIERHEPTAQELVASLRSAADQLLIGVGGSQARVSP